MAEAKVKAKEYLKKGLEFYGRKEYDAAIIWLTRSLELYPSDGAYNARGCAYLEAGEYDKAISDFTAAIEICPPEDNVGMSKTYYNRAESYRRKGNADKALVDIKAALELDFTNKEAQRLYGYLTKCPFPSWSILLKYYKKHHAHFDNLDGQMVKKRPFVYTWFGVLWLGTCFWYMAGLISIHVSIEYLQIPAVSPTYWFLMKAALPWGTCGLVWTAWLWRGYPLRLVQNAQELQVIMRGAFILSVFVVTGLLAAMYRWYLPWLELPANMALKSGNTCRIVSWFVTFGASVLTNSLVKAHLLRQTLERTSQVPD